MEFLKTLGYFAVNKALELWHSNIKPGLCFLVTLLLAYIAIVITIVSALWLVGAIEIGITSAVGLSHLSLWLCTWILDSDGMGMHGICILDGTCTSVITAVVYLAYDGRKTFIDFIKSNWNLAKSRQLYKPQH